MMLTKSPELDLAQQALALLAKLPIFEDKPQQRSFNAWQSLVAQNVLTALFNFYNGRGGE
jgi:hypothetical protein